MKVESNLSLLLARSAPRRKRSDLLWVFLIALAVIFHFPSVAEAGPIYVYKKNGVIRFSNTPPPDGISAKVFTAKKSKFSHYRSGRKWGVRSGRLYRSRYADIIRAASRKHGIEERLIRAIIHAESAFNVKAVSPKGALGLMQIMPSNFRRLGVRDPFSPTQNIQGGVRLLAMLIRKYTGNLRFALAAYNAGEGAVQKYGGVPPYGETRQYIERVLALRTRYGT